MSEHNYNTSGWCSWHRAYCHETEPLLRERIAALEADNRQLMAELVELTKDWMDLQRATK